MKIEQNNGCPLNDNGSDHYFVSFADGRHDESEPVIFCVKCGETRLLVVAEKVA